MKINYKNNKVVLPYVMAVTTIATITHNQNVVSVYAANTNVNTNNTTEDANLVDEEELTVEEINAFNKAYKNVTLDTSSLPSPKSRTVTDSITVNAKEVGNLKGNKSDESAKLQYLFDYLNKTYPDKKIIIHFPAGEYYASKKITLHSNMTITGEKDKTIFKNTKRRPFFLNGVEGNKTYYQNAAANITIKNVTFKNSRVISIGHSKGPILIENIKVIDQPNSHAIEISSSKNVTIRNCVFEGLDRNDTHESMAHRDYNEMIQIDECKEAAFGHFGKYNTGNKKTDLFTSDVLIEGNVFKPSSKNAYPVAVGGHGSYKDVSGSFSNITIRNNTFVGATKAAVRMPLTNNLVIENNTFKDMKHAFMYSSNSNTVETKDITINKNTFTNVHKSIRFTREETAKPIKNITVSNNKITGTSNKKWTDNGYGVYTDSALNNVLIENNTISNSIYGVILNNKSNTSEANKITIKGNTFTHNYKSIRVAKEGSKAVKNVTIDSNNITGIGENLSSSYGDYGIYTDNVSDVTIKNSKYKNLRLNTSLKLNGKSRVTTNGDLGKGYNQPTSNNTTSSSNTTTSTKKTGIITANAVRLRTGAGTNYGIITQLNKGTAVTIEGTSGSWTKVKVNSSGKVGYVYNEYVQITSSSNTTTSAKKTGTITANAVRLRTGAGTNYGIITQLNKGTAVTIEGTSGSWTKVKVNSSGKVGYVYSEYIKIK